MNIYTVFYISLSLIFYFEMFVSLNKNYQMWNKKSVIFSVNCTFKTFICKQPLLTIRPSYLLLLCPTSHAALTPLIMFSRSKNASRSKEETDNMLPDKTEQVTSGMKQSFSFQMLSYLK